MGSLLLPKPEIFPRPQPLAAFKTPPPPAKAIPVHPAPALALRKRITKDILVLSHSLEQRALGHPLPPSQSSGGQRVPLETTSWCLSRCAPVLCGGRGLHVRAQVSCLAVGGPDTCAWGTCVCFLVSSSMGLSVRIWVHACVSVGLCFSPLARVCISLGMYILECVPPCVRVSVPMSPRVGSSAQQPSPW